MLHLSWPKLNVYGTLHLKGKGLRVATKKYLNQHLNTKHHRKTCLENTVWTLVCNNLYLTAHECLGSSLCVGPIIIIINCFFVHERALMKGKVTFSANIITRKIQQTVFCPFFPSSHLTWLQASTFSCEPGRHCCCKTASSTASMRP